MFPNRTACKASALPPLAGLSVLDIGGYDGSMAALCLERGAASAIVVDNQQHLQYEGYPAAKMPAGVAYALADVMEYEGAADVVLCFDVLYHVQAPLLVAQKLYHLTKRYLCLSTRIVPGDAPVWKLLAPREQHTNDPTVCWKPTLAGLHKLMTVVGFKDPVTTYLEMPGLYEPDGLVAQRWSK